MPTPTSTAPAPVPISDPVQASASVANPVSQSSGLITDNSEVEATQKSSLTFDEIAEKILDSKISKATNKVLTYVLTALAAAILGIVIAIAFDLNSKIYEAVGKQSVSKEISDFKIQELQKQVQSLKKQLYYYECMDDVRVKNKAECYRNEP